MNLHKLDTNLEQSEGKQSLRPVQCWFGLLTSDPESWSIDVDSRPYHCGCHYQRVSLLSENAILVFKNCANVMLQLIHFETIQRIFIYLFPCDIPTCSPYFVKYV